MTAIGKIFVIINLVFSVLVAGFIVMVYARSVNWADAAKKWQDAQKQADASRSAVEAQLADERTNSAKALAARDQDIAKLKGDLAAEQAKVADREQALAQFKIGDNGKVASYDALKTELEKRKAEVTGLEDQVKQKDTDIAKYIELKNKANDDKVAAEIKANSFQAKAERLEARVRETEVELVKLKRTGGGAAAGGISLVNASNPPPQSVEGVVTETTNRGDLLRLSVGSDAGLEKGHTLDLYRLKPTPQYLGQVRLTDVRAAESVAVPVDKLKGPVQKGDIVASEVMTKK
jgi:hypothetical protein